MIARGSDDVARAHPAVAPLPRLRPRHPGEIELELTRASSPLLAQLAAPAIASPPPGGSLGTSAGLDKGEVTDRVINVVKNFNKVEPAKVRPRATPMTGDYPKPPQPPRRIKYSPRVRLLAGTSRSILSHVSPLSPALSTGVPHVLVLRRLGLDSLDTVEVVMAMEEEFAVEIPDAEADKITSVAEAVEYLANNANAK